jgi:hypothetical protein
LVTCFVVGLALPPSLLHAQAPREEPSWGRQFGTARVDQANGIAVSDGSVYVVGDVTGALPGQTSEFPNEKGAFLRKYDFQGNVVWTRQFGHNSPGQDSGTSVAANASGVYIAGWTSAKSGQHEAFVQKYDADGREAWTRQFGSTAWVEAFGVTVDAGGVYVAGYVDCCAATLIPTQKSAGATDAFVRKYDLNGTEVWTRQFGSPDSDRATGIVADATGVYVAGTTQGALASPRAMADGFLRKYDSDGTEVWTKQFGGPASEEVNVVAVGASGVYVGGRTTGALQGDPPVGLWDAFVMQFDSTGNHQWTRQFGGRDADNVFGLAVGLTHLLVTGAADGPLPGQNWVAAQDAFYRFYDFTGAEAATREFGNEFNDYGTGAAADARAFYVAGMKNGGALGMTVVGDADAFVLKMAPKPPEKEEVRPGPAPARGGARGGRAGRAGGAK